MKIQSVTSLIIALSLSACGGGGGGGGGGPGGLVLAVSGAQVSLTGTYTTGCRTKSGIDTIEDMVISGSSWSYTRTSYGTADSSCGGAGTTTATGAGTSSTGATGAITGWTEDDGLTPATAPTAADLSGPLSDTEAYTSLTLTVTAASGAFPWAVTDVVPYFYIVDDTGAANILYIPDSATTATPSGSFTKT